MAREIFRGRIYHQRIDSVTAGTEIGPSRDYYYLFMRRTRMGGVKHEKAYQRVAPFIN